MKSRKVHLSLASYAGKAQTRKELHVQKMETVVRFLMSFDVSEASSYDIAEDASC